jgi:hypothetical protein
VYVIGVYREVGVARLQLVEFRLLSGANTLFAAEPLKMRNTLPPSLSLRTYLVRRMPRHPVRLLGIFLLG